MKTFYITLFVLVGTFSLSAINCNMNTSSSSQDDKTIKKEERTVGKFDGIGLCISADVKLTQGSHQSVTIEGAASDIEKIVTEINGSKLIIKDEHDVWHMNRIHKVTIYITMEDIKELTISGSGSIIAQNSINANELTLSISGSGSIDISDLKAVNLSSHISGSGSIKLSGKGTETKMHEIHISGSGDVLVMDLPTQDVDIHISGSGNCKVTASNKLVARVSGSGNVYYSGKPVIDANVSGSGKIKEMSM